MTDREALYRAILTHPHDDTPRLVYADWLEENGHSEEGEFIRVDCRLDSAGPGLPDYTDLVERQTELRLWLHTHAPQVLPKLSGGLTIDIQDKLWRWKWTRRGFPRFLNFQGERQQNVKAIRRLAPALDKAMRRVPTRWLVLLFVLPAHLKELLKQPVVEQLDRLTVQLSGTEYISDETAVMIAASPRLRNLRGLSLAFAISDAGLTALARSEYLGMLDWLALDFQAITAAGVRALVTAPWFRNLRWLRLQGEITEGALEELSRCEAAANLNMLELRIGTHSVQTWEAFGASKLLAALPGLDLSHVDLGEGRLEALLGTNRLQLAVLDLQSCAIRNTGVQALVAAPWVHTLRSLNLKNNGLAAAGLTAVGRCKSWSQLRHLNLNMNSLGVGALRAIAANPSLRGLRSLELSVMPEPSRALRVNHLHEFLDALHMPELRHLDLAGLPVGTPGARALEAEKFQSLRRLSLQECKLNDKAVAALLAAPSLQNLLELNLTGNFLKHGLKPLTDPEVLPNLSAAWIRYNRPPPELKRKLARRAGVNV